MTDMTNVANNMGETIKAFRSAAVAAENKATPMARSILAALMTGVASPDKVVATVIASFGNPKSPKTGKPVDKLSGLRDFVGGDATRKTVESILKAHENAKGNDALVKLVTSFVLDADGAPKSLRALIVAISDKIRADAAKEVGPSEKAETNTGNTGDDAKGGVTITDADLINKAALVIAGLDDAAFLALSDNVAALRKAIADRMDAYATAQLKLAA